jgi:predicted RNA-binding protein associated with RNAse of E/G family
VPSATQFTFGYRRPPAEARTFESLLLRCDQDLLLLAHHLQPKVPLVVDGHEVLVPGDLAVWFLFNGEPYDIARVYSPQGRFRGYYVDALEPVHWKGSDPFTLEPLTDLFLDMWISPHLNHSVLDEDELDAARSGGIISETQARLASGTVAQLGRRLSVGDFPPGIVLEFDLAASGASALLTRDDDA